MDVPAAQHLDDFVVALAASDDLRSDLQAHFGDDTQHVALILGRIGANDEVGTPQGIEMRGVVRYIEGHVEQLAQLLDR